MTAARGRGYGVGDFSRIFMAFASFFIFLTNYLNRSRDAESVKRLQQGGKREKFWRTGEDYWFVTGQAELFGSSPKGL